jgi:predicted ester cyclase
MDPIEIIKAYYAALDSEQMDTAGQYLSDQYQLVDFMTRPMDKEAMLEMMQQLRVSMPNMKHSLSNIRIEERFVKLTVQISGTNTAHLDLRKMGIGVIPRSKKFIIFPNASYEFLIQDGKIVTQKDVSPPSPNRRMSGILKAFGVTATTI